MGKTVRIFPGRDQLKCGNCGGEDHKLFQTDGPIFVLCNKCQNMSELTVTEPKLIIQWVDGSNGLLTKF